MCARARVCAPVPARTLLWQCQAFACERGEGEMLTVERERQMRKKCSERRGGRNENESELCS